MDNNDKDVIKVLDVFCGAGGASVGIKQASDEFGMSISIVGVDINPQPHYPFEFHQMDAIQYMEGYGRDFDYIHASPPCQAFSAMRKGRWQDREHPDLISPTRELLMHLAKYYGVEYDIENVPGAPLINPIMLCGSMFGLQTKFGSQLRRHRLFETNYEVGYIPPCKHNKGSVIGVYGGGQHPNRRKIPATIGVYGHAGGSSNRDNIYCFSTEDRRDAMGIDWMTGKELSEAIPPAYTKFIFGRWLIG